MTAVFTRKGEVTNQPDAKGKYNYQ
jgi:hypothetical protein